MSESTIEVEATEQDGADVDAHFEEVGQRIRCNSCGFEKLRSEPGGCPEGHVAGWSYVPPDAEASPESADLPEVIPAGDDDGAELEVEPEPAEVPVEDDVLAQIEEATAEVCRAQMEADEAGHEEAEAILVKKAATSKKEAKIDWLRTAAKRLRKLREGRFPDGDKYPMFDRPKDQINAQFAKPESIPPLPADTEEEFFRRKGRDTRLADMGLPKRVVTAMEKGGYVTFADVGKLTEASAPLTSVKGVGEEAAGAIMDALATEAQKWADEWKATHPEPEPEAEVEGA